MDEKHQDVEHSRPPTRPYSKTRRLIAAFYFLVIFSCIAWLYAYSVTRTVCGLRTDPKIPTPISKHLSQPSTQSKVHLEAHIMSKCPDAQVCLKELVVPAMQEISDKVTFSLSYIGSVDSNDNVECMHGAGECLGNILELCAAELYPDPKTSLGFTMCLTNDFQHIPEKSLVEECALEHGLDFDKINDCASKDDGSHGLDLLRQSMARSANANVTISCTVRLNDEVRCIRDGGKWKDCKAGSKPKDLIRDIIDAGDEALHDSSLR